MQKIKLFFSFSIILSFLFACNPARQIPQGKYLLVNNKVITDTLILGKESFLPFIKQKPNRKILGLFRFHLGVYNLGSWGKDKKFNRWLKSIGEEPVVLDSVLTERSKQQINLYLSKNGFFNAVISDSIKTHKKKANVNYHIQYNKPYLLRRINYTTVDTGISNYINYYQASSLLHKGDRYNEEIFEKERERIVLDLKDRGYYFFNRNYITFQVDTSLKNHEADVYMYINRINENLNPNYAEYEVIKDHQSYRLRKIFIQTDYNPKNPGLSIPKDTLFYNGYYLLSMGEKRVLRENVLLRNLFIKEGDTYLQRDLDYTYKKLQELNIFKFVNFNFSEVPRDSGQNEYLLDLKIQLTPMEKQDYTTESEATNSGGNIGIAGSFGYRNKNTFRGAEVLAVKLKGGLEAIPNFNSVEETKRLYFFNTYEIGPEISLNFKKFLLPAFLERKTSRYANPKTNINLGFNKQARPDYTRSISNFGLSYNWTPTRKQQIIFYPIDINSVKVSLSPEFKSKLETLSDPRLLYTYDTHIISSTHATWIYNNQKTRTINNFIFLRITGEVSAKIFKESLNPSQFVKSDFDISYHQYINSFNNVVYRLAAGYGLPYGTSESLPFEKSFFGGGANSVRAWNTRTLGPGSYKKDINIEQSGDIKIETNVEFRSELFTFPNGMILEGATFVDAGNIWTRNKVAGRPGGEFTKDFIGQMGIGGGVGMRFNFSFFILRLDAALKLRDPSLDVNERWVYPNQKFGLKDFTWNLAIGYPF